MSNNEQHCCARCGDRFGPHYGMGCEPESGAIYLPQARIHNAHWWQRARQRALFAAAVGGVVGVLIGGIIGTMIVGHKMFYSGQAPARIVKAMTR